jgi:4-hydroxy-tetrahydrodipicolinate synthase
MPLFHGLSAFPITPADEGGRVDARALTVLLGRLQAAGVDSVGLLGSTGIYAYLARSERRRAIEAAADAVGGRIPIIVGVGALRTDDAKDLAQDAQAAGANGLLLAPVSYTPLTDEEVFQHFAAVAGASDLPLCIYNNPSTTHFNFSDELIARLAWVPRIVAVKNPAPAPTEAKAQIEALRAQLPADFVVGYSGDWHSANAILAGGVAWYSVIGGLLPQPSLALTRAAQAGDTAEVHRLDAAFAPFWDLFKQFGSIRVVYAAANLLGLTDAQPPRPILPLGAPPHRSERAQFGHSAPTSGV